MKTTTTKSTNSVLFCCWEKVQWREMGWNDRLEVARAGLNKLHKLAQVPQRLLQWRLELPIPFLPTGDDDSSGSSGSEQEALDWNELGKTVLNEVVSFALKLVACVVIVVVGFIAISILSRIVKAIGNARKWDKTVCVWLDKGMRVLLKVIVLIIALGTLGVDMTTAALLLTALGVAVSAACGSTTLNFVCGAALLATKPFRVGDWVAVSGVDGVVERITMFNTRLCSWSNTMHVVPNSTMFNSVLTNYSVLSKHRLDMYLPIAFREDIDAARDVILAVLRASPVVLAHPRPFVRVENIDGARITLVVTPWVRRNDDPFFYVQTRWDLAEQITVALRAAHVRLGCDAEKLICRFGDREPAPKPQPKSKYEVERLLDVEHDEVFNLPEPESRFFHSRHEESPLLRSGFVYNEETDVPDADIIDTHF